MAAYYDTYDYPAYWEGREYEHESEVIALKAFLNQIRELTSVADIGCGYGRLTPYYEHRAKRILLSDPSASLLSEARERLADSKKMRFVHSTVENLPEKVRSSRFDLVILVRVLHHVGDLDKVLKIVHKFVNPGGYLILEFANKVHWKEIFSNFLKGEFTFPLDIFPYDKRRRKKKNNILFVNYHPDVVMHKLESFGFKIIEKRSVSNVRSPFLKKYLPIEFLLLIESVTQKILSYVYFGPSIFVLARKRG